VYDIFISLADNNNLHVWHCHMFHTVCDVEWLLYCIHFHQMFPKCQHILISPNPKSKYKTKFKFRIKNSSYYFNTVIDIYEIFKYLYNIIAIEQQHILHHYNFFSQNTFTQSVLQISFKLYLSTCFKLYLSTCFKLYLSTCIKLYLSTCFKFTWAHVSNFTWALVSNFTWAHVSNFTWAHVLNFTWAHVSNFTWAHVSNTNLTV
jgi:hypothetical protein